MHAALRPALLAIAALVALAAPARAYEVPPFKGNDTGGIIAWALASQTDVRQLAIDHCAAYGKAPKLLGAQRTYGGYISFACVWVRPRPVNVTLRVAY